MEEDEGRRGGRRGRLVAVKTNMMNSMLISGGSEYDREFNCEK